MAKKFEEMSPDVQASLLRVLESKLTAGNVDAVIDAVNIVDLVVAAFGRLYPENKTAIGEIVINILTEIETK